MVIKLGDSFYIPRPWRMRCQEERKRAIMLWHECLR